MNYDLWDLVYTEYPYREDPTITKARPVIIIDDLGDEFTLCPLTKSIGQAKNFKYTILIEKDSDEGIEMELGYTSLIILDTHRDFRKILLFGRPKRCPDSVIDKIEEKLQEMRDNGDYR